MDNDVVDRFSAMSAFVAVCDAEGFSAAARRLGVAPSAVSRLVSDLEAHLGIRLLQRTTRSVSLTDAGARYLERSRRVLADVAEAEASAEADRAAPAGDLVVAAPITFGRLHVGPLVCGYLLRFEDVVVDLQLTDRTVNLVDEGVDVALRIGELSDSSLIARRVGTTRRVLVASTGYLKKHGRPKEPGDLSHHSAITSTPVAPGSEWKFFRRGREEHVRVRPRYVTNSAEAAVWHASMGGGLTLAFSYQVVEQIRSGALEVVLEDFEPPELPIQFVYPTSRLLSVKVRALIDLAVEMTDWNFTSVD